ncbi:zinc finger BED domain-containing protein RICESLEEPER 2-like protein [Tanacetum coccineum]
MMKRVIAFEDFLVPHTGSALAKMLINVFVKFKLKNKIMSITLDNASNNTSAIGKVRLKYEPPMEGRFYHSRCVPHIINLCVQDGLAVKEINTIKESFKTMLKDVFKSSGKKQQRYSKIYKQAGKPCLSPHWDVLTRWNSTYHMFLSGLKQKSTLMYFHDLLASKNRCHQFSAENWVIIEGLTQLLEVFNNATKVLSGVYYPTSPLVLQQIVFMTTKLTEYEFEGGIFATMVKPMKEKLKKYFERMPPIITCAAALNPCFNVHGVEFLIESISTDLEFFDDSYATKAKKWFTDSFEDFVTMLQATEFETFDVLGFWKAKETMFPVLSRMAMDILCVQATSVASESAFSTNHLDAQERKQDKSTLETPVDFEEEILDAEVQANEAIPLSDEEITLDAASSEGSMSGPGSEGEEVEAEANYGYGVYHDDY